MLSIIYYNQHYLTPIFIYVTEDDALIRLKKEANKKNETWCELSNTDNFIYECYLF